LGDRKYRHRGYMDSDSPAPSGGAPRNSGTFEPPRPPRLEGAPRGRSAGAPGPEVFKCARCGEVRREFSELPSDAVCHCGSDLHSCINCKHFDTSAQWECRTGISARVSPKDARNQCALFAPRIIRDLAADKASKIATPDNARKAFEDLFKK
jgi:hypothetical protein